MKTMNLCVAAAVLFSAAFSSSAYAQDVSSYRIRVSGAVPDICHASTQSAVVNGDRVIVTIDRMCNRAHVLQVAAPANGAVRITESRTGRPISDGVARFSSAAPQQGRETLVIQFQGADPRVIANANIRVSVSSLAA